VPFLRSREVGAARSTASAESVAQRAVDAELELARLDRFGIAGEGVVIVRYRSCGQQH
jgi:hypothetical protein